MTGTAVDGKDWTVLSLIGWSAHYLSSKEIDSPRLTAELLLCHVLDCRRIELYTSFDRLLTAAELAQFKSHLKRRLAHEPVQYIVGYTEFMGLRFEVDPRTLIPRPETELLVEQVIGHAREAHADRLRVLDIGTGSGNIAISLAKFLPGAEALGIDVSPHALESAGRNVRLHGVEERVKLMLLDIFREHDRLESGLFDYVVSNPPYIPQAEVASLPAQVREYEPLLAVQVDGDGLAFFRSIATIARELLKKGGWLFLEIGFEQYNAVCAILSAGGYDRVEGTLDYGGILRVVKAQVSPAG